MELRKKMLSETERYRYLEETLKMRASDVLTNMETSTGLFKILLCSYLSQMHVVKNASFCHTNYRLSTPNNRKIQNFVSHSV